MPSYDDVVRWVKPGHEYHQNRYARGLAGTVQAGCRWLDIGAGTQIHGGWLGPSSADVAARASTVVGCDVVAEHIRLNPLLTERALADVGSLPFRSGSFDVVTANMVLEHLEHPAAVLQEIDRVLVPGGRFLFVTPNRTNPAIAIASIVLSRPLRKMMARFVEKRPAEHIFLTFYRVNSARAIKRRIAGTSLRVRELDHFNSHPMVRRPWPLTLVEALWIKMILAGPLRFMSSNLYGDLEKSTDP